ncbi:hypothetical protein WS87_10930 [Burkholderia sp. MSMB0856]|uniref:helix-turn-helix domain-containing protein n=1 Tax=Burkholderia sp. MSMB0856 TaxID=1637869 RepID=UPI000758ADE3|nr:helix-turn-helix domain-containing protein [Burkholderia sp. MSMB0856]AOJ87150.1 hypothetical protein WS87_10930 [Burkholderia sp. MSMB0856]KVH38855.1 hypothetical protein WS87_05130 [Burkholderia sp. MSMB0856]
MPTLTATQEISPAVLTTDQAAVYLGIAPRTLEQWRSNRHQRIPFVKIGGRVRYRLKDLDAWIASRVVEA